MFAECRNENLSDLKLKKEQIDVKMFVKMERNGEKSKRERGPARERGWQRIGREIKSVFKFISEIKVCLSIFIGTPIFFSLLSVYVSLSYLIWE